MEHEVYVPLSVGPVRAALAERERVARCVPGLQLDAAPGGGAGLKGRLRVRAGGSTITYRGRLKFTPLGDGFSVRGSGEEVRGDGSVKLTLKVVPRLADDGVGTRLMFAGKVTGRGRIADLEDKAAAAAGRRLLDRFCAALAAGLSTEGAPGAEEPGTGREAGEQSGTGPDGEPEARIDARQAAGLGEPDDNDRAIPGIPGPEKRGKDGTGGRDSGAGKDAGTPGTDPGGEAADAAPDAGTDPAAGPGARDDADAEAEAEADADADAEAAAGTTGGVFETEVPPPSLDPLGESAESAGADEVVEPDAATEEADGERADAEAAHARRTMIGRSAEEVDHAPPRGRYAPVPAPEPSVAAETLRWAAPAAALALAGAVVLSRALRRRR